MNEIASHHFFKFKKSYDLPLDLLQYRRENSAEIAGGQEVDRNFS